jgi:glutamine amidotransferase
MPSQLGKITILDLGINNINSVRRAFQQSNQSAEIKVLGKDDYSDKSNLIVLPGLGHFASGMEQLRIRRLDHYLLRAMESRICIVGICLGMQLLGHASEESPGIHGLGLIDGESRILPVKSEERIPNVGWMGGTPYNEGKNFPSLGKGKDFYFVHSYHFIPKFDQDCIFKSNYGDLEITTGIKHANVLGFQFHPEKSSFIGNELIVDISKWAMSEN